MKKPISLKLFLGWAILAGVLVGSPSTQTSHAQPQSFPPPSTDLISTSPANAPTTGTLPADIDPNGTLAQVVRLLQAGVEQSVILTYIGNSTSPFNLTSDDIIYLNDIGAPAEIAKAMMQRDQQLQQMGVAAGAPATPAANTTETPTTQPAEVTVNYFYDTLTPYGGWVDIEGYGWCWRPTIVIYDAGWQPYCNNGHWVYTDCGWYWVSGYSWGWAPFHYGRWFHNPRYGWCWWPDTTWASSWVCWRHNNDYCGWAPLPPHAVYQSGVGFVYQGHAVSAGFTFGLSANVFTFVPTKDFCDPHPRRHRLEAGEVTRIYNQTTVINNINFDNRHQGMVNVGIPPHDITAVTRQEIHPITVRTESGSTVRGGHREQFEHNGSTLIVNRPHFVGSPVLSVHPETRTTVGPRQNEFHPVVHGNQNYASPHPNNPTPNNPPHQDVSPNSHPNFNRTPPRVPQSQQPEVPHTPAPDSQGHINTTTTRPGNHSTWPAQNQMPNHNYTSGNKVLSPRAQGFEQQPSPGASYHPQQHGNAAMEQHSSPPSTANHYSPPSTAPQNNHSASANESHHNDQNFNHSESHAASHPASSSSPPSNRQGQNKDNNQNSQKGH